MPSSAGRADVEPNFDVDAERQARSGSQPRKPAQWRLVVNRSMVG
jgi:hypothetical protein